MAGALLPLRPCPQPAHGLTAIKQGSDEATYFTTLCWEQSGSLANGLPSASASR